MGFGVWGFRVLGVWGWRGGGGGVLGLGVYGFRGLGCGVGLIVPAGASGRVEYRDYHLKRNYGQVYGSTLCLVPGQHFKNRILFLLLFSFERESYG